MTPTLFTSLGSSVVDENMLSIPDVATRKQAELREKNAAKRKGTTSQKYSKSKDSGVA